MNSRLLLAVALLAVLALAHAGGKPTPKPQPKPQPKPAPNPQEWCDKSTPPKCGNWANEKKQCNTTCANGGTCSFKPGGSIRGSSGGSGQCCKCRTQFDSKDCVCGGGTTGATSTFCSSSTPGATNTCISCQKAICDSVCDYNFKNDPDLTSPYTYDGSLPLLNANAASCPKTAYTCGTCPCPCAAGTYCSATPGTCGDCKTAICASVCDYNFKKDPDLPTSPYTYTGALTLLDPKAATCPKTAYSCGTCPCPCAAGTYCSATPGTCGSCQTAICNSVCDYNFKNDPDLPTSPYSYTGALTLLDPKAATCPQTDYTCPACTCPCAAGTYCSATPGACDSCKTAICASVCDYNFKNDPDLPTSPYTYDGSLTLLDPKAGSCAKTDYTCGTCPCPCAAGTYCSATPGACDSCQTAICDTVCTFNFNNDPATSGTPDLPTSPYSYTGSLTLLDPKAATCAKTDYTCGCPCTTNCGGTDPTTATFCTAAVGTCSSCKDAICASVCANNFNNDPFVGSDIPPGDYAYTGALTLVDTKAASCPQATYNCPACPCSACGGTDPATATFCSNIAGTCSLCSTAICNAICAFNAANDPTVPPNTPDIDTSAPYLYLHGSLPQLDPKADGCAQATYAACGPCPP